MGANILARRKAQRELRAALDELESIFANSQVGINVNSRLADFPSELHPILTTMLEETGQSVA